MSDEQAMQMVKEAVIALRTVRQKYPKQEMVASLHFEDVPDASEIARLITGLSKVKIRRNT